MAEGQSRTNWIRNMWKNISVKNGINIPNTNIIKLWKSDSKSELLVRVPYLRSNEQYVFSSKFYGGFARLDKVVFKAYQLNKFSNSKSNMFFVVFNRSKLTGRMFTGAYSKLHELTEVQTITTPYETPELNGTNNVTVSIFYDRLNCKVGISVVGTPILFDCDYRNSLNYGSCSMEFGVTVFNDDAEFTIMESKFS